MTVSIEKIKIPIDPSQQYELIDDISDDDRFKRVKIWIAHSGENLNNSVFEKETLVKMIDTLPAVPIVGYMEVNQNDENDFSNHREKITLKNNDIEIEYMCHAYGFIPSNHNAKIEYRGGKEWLTAEGYLWTKFEKSIEIFDDSGGSKSHSMEIDNVEGFIDNEGRINVESARFSALCILGEFVNPGMDGSTIEYFNANSIQNEIKQMMIEFSRKGEKQLDPEKEIIEKELDNSTDFSKDEKQTEETDKEKADVEDKDETEEQEIFEKGELDVDEDDKKDEKQFQLIYSLSHEDLKSKLYGKIDKKDDNVWNWILETYDNYFIYQEETYENEKYEKHYYKCDFSADSEVVLGDKVEVFSEFLTIEEIDKLKETRDRIVALENELNAIKLEKDETEKAKREKLVESYSEQLTEEELTIAKDKVQNLSYEDLEKEIAFMLFKRQSFSAEEATPKTVAVKFSGEQDGRYGDLDRYFE